MDDILDLNKNILMYQLNQDKVYPVSNKNKRERFTVFRRMRSLQKKYSLYVQTYFIACNIYDIILYKNKKFVFGKSNNFLANVFMYMASKFEDVQQLSIYRIVESEEEKKEIILFESKAFEMLEFKIPYVTTFLFLKQFLELVIYFHGKLEENPKKVKYLQKMLFENHIHSPKPSYNAIHILSKTFKMREEKVSEMIQDTLNNAKR